MHTASPTSSSAISSISLTHGTAAPSDAARASSKAALWSGRVVSGVAIAFLTFDTAVKLLQAPQAVSATQDLGYPSSAVAAIGVIELLCLIAYVVPRSAVLGAVLWTGYLGGAIATHLRLGNPLASHTLFPIYVAALIWGGLWLRDGRLRAFVATTFSGRHK